MHELTHAPPGPPAVSPLPPHKGTGAPGSLYMIQLDIPLTELTSLERKLRLPRHHEDLDYLVHAITRHVFGPAAPSPFSSAQIGRDARILGYGSASTESMLEQAATFAEPGIYAALQRGSISSKPMPSRWPEGLELAFDLRCCPVSRLSKAKWGHRAGAEVDAFLLSPPAEQSEEATTARREAAYKAWLLPRLEQQGFLVSEVSMRRFERKRLIRRTQGASRKASVIERPDVLMQGRGRVTSSAAFFNLLKHGLGRHKAFGFGMFLVRRPRPCS